MSERLWSALGFMLNIIACMFTVLGFSTPYWMVSEEGKIISTQLERLGLWEICFKLYTEARDPFGRVYNGCWWIFSREYDNIRKYIITTWFATTQALVTHSVVITLLCVLLGLMMLLKCFPKKVQLYIAYTVTVCSYLVCLSLGVACVSFGINAATDQSWLKQPRLRQLSWSFWLIALAVIMTLLAGCFYTVYSVKLRAGGHRSTAYRAHELRHYGQAYFR